MCIRDRENCDVGISDNLMLYGHHMNNGSMFSDLCKYESEDFYQMCIRDSSRNFFILPTGYTAVACPYRCIFSWMSSPT